ncbi:MAG: hypothetical protein HY356_00740 [Gammaproteobacteria bacterium]|nr:hypothetical protein [Gammaproteobacteria bacterium]
MNIFGFIYVLFISGILVFTGIRLVSVINGNFRTGQRLRETLADRIKLIRLGRMIKMHGIDIKTYLHKAPVHEIESNIRDCEGCNRITDCDGALGGIEPMQARNLSFCPNDEFLQKL